MSAWSSEKIIGKKIWDDAEEVPFTAESLGWTSGQFSSPNSSFRITENSFKIFSDYYNESYTIRILYRLK